MRQSIELLFFKSSYSQRFTIINKHPSLALLFNKTEILVFKKCIMLLKLLLYLPKCTIFLVIFVKLSNPSILIITKKNAQSSIFCRMLDNLICSHSVLPRKRLWFKEVWET